MNPQHKLSEGHWFKRYNKLKFHNKVIAYDFPREATTTPTLPPIPPPLCFGAHDFPKKYGKSRKIVRPEAGGGGMKILLPMFLLYYRTLIYYIS